MESPQTRGHDRSFHTQRGLPALPPWIARRTQRNTKGASVHHGS